MEPLSIRLRGYRIKLGLSQEEFAEKINVSTVTISNWETGKTAPNYFQLCDMKRVYGNIVAWEELMSGIPHKSLEEFEKELILLEKEIENRMSYEDKLRNFLYESSIDAWTNIKEINKPGHYSISVDDLTYAFGYYSFDAASVAALATLLKKDGYLITSVFGNGLSIYIRNHEEAEEIYRSIDMIVDQFIHYPENPETAKILHSYRDEYNAAEIACSEKIRKNIFDIDNLDDVYIIFDKNGSERGVSNSREKCEEIAKEQKLSEYKILKDE